MTSLLNSKVDAKVEKGTSLPLSLFIWAVSWLPREGRTVLRCPKPWEAVRGGLPTIPSPYLNSRNHQRLSSSSMPRFLRRRRDSGISDWLPWSKCHRWRLDMLSSAGRTIRGVRGLGFLIEFPGAWPQTSAIASWVARNKGIKVLLWMAPKGLGGPKQGYQKLCGCAA